MSRVATLIALLLAGSVARAEPYRLRADALGSTPSPSGLVVLGGEARPGGLVNAEAVIWAGTGGEHADALIALVRVRHPSGRGDLTLGRFVLTTGAVRPVHMDGLSIRTKLPAGLGFELFGGVPVAPLQSWNDDQRIAGVPGTVNLHSWDWLYGARASETLGGIVGGGLSYFERRDFGRVADQEVGADLWVSPTPKLDFASRASYDVPGTGLSELQLSAAWRTRPVRLEVFGTHRSPSLLLPTTSIFSAIGDVPSNTAGLVVTWFAAPRLDVLASGAAREVDDDVGAEAWARATLRLDEEGDGAVSVEARRFSVPPEEWTGLKLRARVPVILELAVSTELELAVPDDPRGRGDLWPWGLVSFGGRIAPHWEAAVAMEAFSSPSRLREIVGLARLGYRWGSP